MTGRDDTAAAGCLAYLAQHPSLKDKICGQDTKLAACQGELATCAANLKACKSKGEPEPCKPSEPTPAAPACDSGTRWNGTTCILKPSTPLDLHMLVYHYIHNPSAKGTMPNRVLNACKTSQTHIDKCLAVAMLDASLLDDGKLIVTPGSACVELKLNGHAQYLHLHCDSATDLQHLNCHIGVTQLECAATSTPAAFIAQNLCVVDGVLAAGCSNEHSFHFNIGG
jgi:hypothetical protein